ncbi:hypothetical protein ADIAL_0524 [Alkalibacterium sp. AK22]|uniref:nuclease-related domain-containing protein n=1 Tax=Alkalibacterium sp. AK22 TaxID=1229520 RepID=UPI0004522354|nr:nuclease-related domain-containing protein [Alkalibacterium sp. AK22]EXJ24004.1 hypothetical protein ADIAL_0524 [Alkalibacterium sp. AK22]
MEIVKEREVPHLLKGLTYLDKRSVMKEADKQYLTSLQKNFDGANDFDAKVNTLVNREVIVLNDLLLCNKGLTFQIDTLMLTSHLVHVFEVKNYAGGYLRNPDGFSTILGQKIADPLLQLKRTTSFLMQLLQDWASELKVQGNLVFVNPAFTLYQARIEDPIILPSQIDSCLEALNSHSGGLERQHYQLANRLVKLHEAHAPLEKHLPYYSYEELKKGLSCKACGSFELLITQRSCFCKSCYEKSTVTDVILDNIEELQFLFPDTPLTTATVNEWCGDAVHFRRMRKVLKDHFVASGQTSGPVYGKPSHVYYESPPVRKSK